jgi:hypothetical protein
MTHYTNTLSSAKRHNDPSGVRAAIVIPAHNEANVIRRCLASVLQSADKGEFAITVVCNGCTDDTAAIVRLYFPDVTVIETAVASKVHALNLADSGKKVYPRIYLDADLEITTSSLRSLIEPLQTNEFFISCGNMDVYTHSSSYVVQAFYSVWQHNRYLSSGKFGGVFAISEKGAERLGEFPNVTNDDEYVKQLFESHERAHVNSCVFQMSAPHTLSGLVKIRTRAIRGTVELQKLGYASRDSSAAGSLTEVVKKVLVQPSLWFPLPIYIAISMWVRVKVLLSGRYSNRAWERDESSRGPI